MRTVMRSSAKKEVEAIVVQTVGHNRAPRELILWCGQTFTTAGVCALASRDPPTASGRVQPQGEREHSRAQPESAGQLTAGPARQTTAQHTLTSRANALATSASLTAFPPTHTRYPSKALLCTYGRWGQQRREDLEAPPRQTLGLLLQTHTYTHARTHERTRTVYYAFGRRCDPSHAAQGARTTGCPRF